MNNIKKQLTILLKMESTPFFTKAREDYIKKLCKKEDVKFVETLENICLVPDTQNTSKPKMLFISHLDHPGIVLNSKGSGYVLGSVLENLFESKKLQEVSFINKSSERKEKISTVQQFKVKTTKRDGKNNSILSLNIPKFEETQNKIAGYSLDNDAPTAVLLSLIKIFDELQNGFYEVYFLFTKVEEIHQLSSYKFAKENLINLGFIDYVYNLECKEITRGKKDIKNLVVHKSESYLDYGYLFNIKNSSIKLVRKAEKELSAEIEYLDTKGSTDARSLSNFKLTPNIATISIPNYSKHNIKNNKVVPEKINKKNLKELKNLITKLVIIKPITTSLEGKKHYNKKKLQDKKAINERLLIAYKPWFKYKKVYPDTVKEWVEFSYFKVVSYFKYFITKLTNYYE